MKNEHKEKIIFGIIVCIALVTIGIHSSTRKDRKIIKVEKAITSPYMGIDISHHQGVVDWSKVDSFREKKIDFIYIKSTEGSSYKDRMYKSNLVNAHKKGILVGSYHYFKTTSKAEFQFKNFISVVDKDYQDLVPMIDVEERGVLSDERFHLTLSNFLKLVEDHFDKKPIIYASNAFYTKYLRKRYKDYYFCIARYGGLKPDLPTWYMWQFTERGRLDGFSEYVDVSILNDSASISILKLK